MFVNYFSKSIDLCANKVFANRISNLHLSYIPISIQPPDINNLWQIMNRWCYFI